MEPLSDIEAIQRMAAAMLAGIVLGFERKRADKPAGIRTYMLVTQGAALFMICAIMLSAQVTMFDGTVSDPGRIASTVVQGIGFIAAGVIITTGGREVIGLTTAAGLWVATAIGLLIGAGFYPIALVATIATVIGLILLRQIESQIGAKEKPMDRD
ncbi:MAG: mgtC family protein [Thermomicrobiales bacterium]|jgi:putative Mg2+ transporter-C (MgtC) family protein|nr:mgtC family protein [Thermomicrobiales bacterium]